MRYCPEIDGLRAIAVVSVILFHADANWVHGGFTGVDIFFVISGYLITISIFNDKGLPTSERMVRFYERRIKRIIPALSLIVVFTLATGVLVFLPRDLVQLAQSSIATVLFGSNFWFWSQTGYFAPAAEAMPLLHTWSLAVEEQFYIAFPIFIIALERFRYRTSTLAVIAILLGLFVLSLYLSFHRPGVAFYWPTRAWELLAGALLAHIGLRERPCRNLMSVLGATLLGVSLFSVDSESTFPGYAVLFPVLATLALIYSGGGTAVGQVLSSRPLVWTGRFQT